MKVPQFIQDFHSQFDDSVKWRLTPKGVEVQTNQGPVLERSPGNPSTVLKIWKEYGQFIDDASAEFDVPIELIVATIATESSGKADAIRFEPGYFSDEKTPGKVSPGLMQTLIETAQSALKGKTGSEAVDRAWLLKPKNSIRAGTAYLQIQMAKTRFDPVLVACAYNAGGIYYNSNRNNRWKLRQFPIGTSEHCDRFIKWLNDFMSVLGTIKSNGERFEFNDD